MTQFIFLSFSSDVCNRHVLLLSFHTVLYVERTLKDEITNIKHGHVCWLHV